MRVTDKMLFDRAGVNSGKARSTLEDAVSEAATGLRVKHPWDDPSASGLIVGQRAENSRLKSIEETTARAHDEIVAADSVLSDLTNIMGRAQEIATQLGNGTYTASERNDAATEIEGLFRDAVGKLNTRVANRYIFGGYLDAAPPFDDTGAYVGDTGVRQVEVAPGAYEDASLRADVLAKGAGGGVDLLATLQTLGTALRSGDAAGVRASLVPVVGGINQLAQGRAQAGSMMNLLESANEAAALAKDQGAGRLSKLQDADMVDAASRLALAQRALDAALTASAKSFSLTLLDKLR